MFHWIWVFIIGLVIGLVAKLFMPGKDPGGFIITAIIGIVGSFIGDWIAGATGIISVDAAGRTHGFMGFVLGVIGAIILLLAYRLIFKRTSSR